MTQARRPAKRFAPLNPQDGNDSAAPQLRGIVFDVDGTLWYVSILIFPGIDGFSLLLYCCLLDRISFFADSLLRIWIFHEETCLVFEWMHFFYGVFPIGH